MWLSLYVLLSTGSCVSVYLQYSCNYSKVGIKCCLLKTGFSALIVEKVFVVSVTVINFVLMFLSVWENFKFRQQYLQVSSQHTRVIWLLHVFLLRLNEINQLPSSKTVLLYTPASSSGTYPRLYVSCAKCYY